MGVLPFYRESFIYTSPLGDILRRHNIQYHFYADDTQLYISFDVEDTKSAISTMEACIKDVRLWMAKNFLRLNDSKTEILLIGSNHIASKVPSFSVTIGDHAIRPSDSVRNIGAIFDKTMTMKEQVSHMCRNAWHHLRQIGQIRNYLDTEASSKIIHAFVTSRLDTFNSLLYNLPQDQIKRLQRIQNAAARMITKTRKFDHITPTLQKLHWLPVKYRIEYKILLLTFKALNGMAPSYIRDLIKVSQQSRSRRSNSKNLLIAPHNSHAKTGDRSFTFAAPTLWNKIPQECRDAKTVQDFKSKLKTHLFKQAYKI